MTLLAKGRALLRAWYAHAAGVLAAITGLVMGIDPTLLQAGWQTMPPELRVLIPAKLASYISLALLAGVWLVGRAPRPASAQVLGLVGRAGAVPLAVGPLAIALMHHFERCELVAYRCPAGKWTIGWGMTYYPAGGRVKQGDRITQEQADAMFVQLLERDFAPAVRAAIGAAETTPAQFGAMVALAYNIGAVRFTFSTVARRHRAGDVAGAAEAFLLWNKVNGTVSNGLVRRRRAERALYLSRFVELKGLTNGEVAA
ncbi:lysozyme [uncultured Sphingomonas sp.]|uniref:lysozyme n=1 Tax=uncultured Sphingomonas sp. TaxID=158754 RepID=UPI0030FA297D